MRDVYNIRISEVGTGEFAATIMQIDESNSEYRLAFGNTPLEALRGLVSSVIIHGWPESDN